MQARRLFCSAVREVGWQMFEVPDIPGSHQVVIKAACSLIGHRIQPDDVQKAYEAPIDRPADYLGVLIEWDKTR